MNPAVAEAMADLCRRREALGRRMLAAWDLSWGKPILVEGPMLAPKLRLYDQPERITLTFYVLGLAVEGDPAGTVRVNARDHMDDKGNVLSPLALPPDQLARWLDRPFAALM